MTLYIGYIGLSHLGINHVAASAAKGFKVIGYDKDKKINDLRKGKIDFFERNLKNNLKKHNKFISFTNNLKDLHKCNLIFFSQDVPTNQNGKSDLKKIKRLVYSSIKRLKKYFNCNIISGPPRIYRKNKLETFKTILSS